jgi:uncharacterized LabA/DUF88 family protein
VPYCIGFVDAGYFKAAGARTLGTSPNRLWPVSTAVVAWLRQLAASFPDEQFLRAYWYDGQHDPSHAGYTAQRLYFDAIASTPGIQFRAGHLVQRTPKWQRPIRRAIRESARRFDIEPERFLADFEQRFQFLPERQQKGVDTLITLDLVRLAQQPAYGTGVLIAGDRDRAAPARRSSGADLRGRGRLDVRGSRPCWPGGPRHDRHLTPGLGRPATARPLRGRPGSGGEAGLAGGAGLNAAGEGLGQADGADADQQVQHLDDPMGGAGEQVLLAEAE